MVQPGSPAASMPPDESHIMRRLADLEQQLRELRAADPLRTAGIQVTGPGAITLSGSLDVDADMNVDGDSTFGGSVTITGPLALNPGSIPNDALLSPVTFGNGFNDADGFTLTSSAANICTFNITVPTGYTKCIVIADAVMYVMNTSASVDYAYARVYIDSPVFNTWGRRMVSLVGPNNGSAALAVNKQVQLAGLTGGQQITCRLQAFTAFAPMGDPTNGASINAVAVFSR